MTDPETPLRPDPPPGPPPNPPAPPRQGPRPLALHLGAATAALMGSTAALPPSRSGSLPWRPELAARAEALRPLLAAADPDALARAVEREARRRLDGFLSGVERYRRHPFRRALDDPPTVWREGNSRLLDHGWARGGARGGAGGGPGGAQGGTRTVLLVPSLVNRHYVLDLAEGRSLVRWLAARGLRPLLLDWGRPGEAERRFALADYVAGRLSRALDAATALAGGPVALVGYCMGGMLAAALAGLRPDGVSGLALLATPWDFHADDGQAALRTAAALPLFEPAMAALGELPTDAVQALFAMLDPALALRKFTRFAALDPESEAARGFVALEDWLNDGVPLAAPVARECLGGWYGRNEPARGLWLMQGRPVEPAALDLPTLAIVPERDRIVPPASARALAAAIPGARVLAPPLGHIGMITSGQAEPLVWEPLLRWLVELNVPAIK